MKTEVKTSTRVDNLPHMQRVEFLSVDWKKGNKVMLTNGKTYSIVRFDKEQRRLWLHSEEYNANFWANFRIVHTSIL